jgi:hypothetical protein
MENNIFDFSVGIAHGRPDAIDRGLLIAARRVVVGIFRQEQEEDGGSAYH